MSWKHKLKDIYEHLSNKKWYWSVTEGAYRFKYITIKVDTRDNVCLLLDRHGEEFDLEDLRKLPQKNNLDISRGWNSSNIEEKT